MPSAFDIGSSPRNHGEDGTRQLAHARLQMLIELGIARGGLTYGELVDELPDEMQDEESVEVIVATLREIGIGIDGQASGDTDWPSVAPFSGDAIPDLAGPAISMPVVDLMLGRTVDPIKLYLREMGATPLLMRAEELALAQCIESSCAAQVQLLAACPAAMHELELIARELATGKTAVSTCVSGLVEASTAEIAFAGRSQLLDATLSGQPTDGVDDEAQRDDSADYSAADDAVSDSSSARTAIVERLSALSQRAARARQILQEHGFRSSSYQAQCDEIAKSLTTLRFTARAVRRLAQPLFDQVQQARSTEQCHRTATSPEGGLRSMVRDAGQPALSATPNPRPLLPLEAAQQLYKRIEPIGRVLQDAKSRLLKGNLRLVVAVAKRYPNRGLQLLDLIQEGNLGLMKAVERYDHRRGFKFSTYATWWIRQGILHALADQGRTIRVPSHTADSLNRLSRLTLDYAHRKGALPTPDLLAKDLGMSAAKVRDLMNVVKDPISSDTPAHSNGDLTIGDAIADTHNPSPEQAAIALHLRRAVTTAIDQLPSREATILRLRYGIGVSDEHSLREIGRQLNISAERVRQLEVMAIEKLRESPQCEHLRSFAATET